MTTLNDVKNLLIGYNVKYVMSKTLESSTLASDNSIQTNLKNANLNATVSTDIIDALASIGLYRLLENETSELGVASKFDLISTGIFAQRKGVSEVKKELTIPASINALELSLIKKSLDTDTVTVTLSIDELKKFGFVDRLAKAKREKLETELETIKASFVHLKILNDYFGITEATVIEDTEDKAVYKVTFSNWASVYSKIKSSPGWALVQESIEMVDDNFIINLIHDKTVTETV